ncbi:glycosyltransferase WbsX family protein [Bacillus infantis]|uniref:glycosyltransferase WbsX family protein n=1 Tax=Bacillus infantis TaxID=324767 RepID=UPI003CEAF90C
MKIISFYLPQFHAIPENDKWWGEGFTEWENLKSAEPLFEGHNQPRIPKNNYYYNLLDDEVKEWQINLAKDNGVYGFCFYHYWFDGHKLLEKPLEQFLQNKELDMPFCLCWANEPWTKAWVSKSDEILIDQSYGDSVNWKKHFEYLLPFLKDDRYIKNDGKPLLVVYRPNQIECLNEMLDYWQELAIESGLPGIEFAYQQIDLDLQENSDTSRFSYNIEFEPVYALEDANKKGQNFTRFLKAVDNTIYSIFKTKLSDTLVRKVRTYDYDRLWQAILERKPKDKKSVPGVFVDWDNTPRRKEKGRVFVGGSPEKFEKYLTQQIKRTRDVYKKDMIFLTAWNEWSEGCYLEPDERYGDAYLKSIKNALVTTNEFPEYPDYEKN